MAPLMAMTQVEDEPTKFRVGVFSLRAGVSSSHIRALWGVCWNGWFDLCAMIARCTTGVEPLAAPVSSQSDLDEVRLLKLATIPTHMSQSSSGKVSTQRPKCFTAVVSVRQQSDRICIPE